MLNWVKNDFNFCAPSFLYLKLLYPYDIKAHVLVFSDLHKSLHPSNQTRFEHKIHRMCSDNRQFNYFLFFIATISES